MVEHLLAKEGVGSSNLLFRSTLLNLRRCLSAPLLFAIPSAVGTVSWGGTQRSTASRVLKNTLWVRPLWRGWCSTSIPSSVIFLTGRASGSIAYATVRDWFRVGGSGQ